MTSPVATEAPASPISSVTEPVDLTGRSRMAWNVIISWVGQFVFIVAGFIMPRMIDRRLGQETLGIWDFSWSMVVYFGLIQMGVGSSVSRYVAKYRARAEIDLVSGVVSSVMFLQCGMALAVLTVTGFLAYWLPSIWGDRLADGTGDAQIVLLTLGASLAIQVAVAAFAGVITGCHRWDIHNYIKAGWHAATVAGMIILLQLGCGIRALAIASFAGLALADLTRGIYAFMLCKGLRVSPRFVRLSMIRDAFHFGIKTMVPQMGDVLLHQTSSILVVTLLGPAALALYSRPKLLVQHTGMLVSKLAFVLTPSASALHSTSRTGELRDLLVEATRYAAYVSMPLTIGLSILGTPLMLLWMGPDYANGTLVVLIALGSFALYTFMPAMGILMGLNAHGRPGVVHLLSACCSVGLMYLAAGPLSLGLEGIALAVGLPLTLTHGIYVPFFVCRRLAIPWTRFFWRALARPAACTAPLAACLIMVRILIPTRPLHALGAGAFLGGTVMVVIYWRYVLPGRIKLRVKRLLRLLASPAEPVLRR